MPELCFNVGIHEYRLGSEILPSVTQVLENVGIIDYSHIPWWIREPALKRGAWIHHATALDDQGELVIGPEHPYYGFIVAWRNWRTFFRFTPDFIEERGYHPQFRFAGTSDRRRSGETLVDLKTNDAPWWTRIQTAAYASFHPEPAKYKRVAVELHPDGSYNFQVFKPANWHYDFQTFLAALRVYREKETHREEYR